MRALVVLLLLAVGVGACTVPAAPPAASLPPGVFGTYEDNDIGAINFAAWAFASAANTQGNPAEAARAVIALEYLPGELSRNPRWIGMDSAVKLHMGRARDDLRAILGIRPDAPPQIVVNTMLALALDLQMGNQPAALEVLSAPIFARPPEQTLQILSNLPFVPEANVATSRAQDQSFPGKDGVR